MREPFANRAPGFSTYLSFAHLAAGGTFTTAELHPHVLQALGLSAADYKLASLRCDLWKLRAKALIEKIVSCWRFCAREAVGLKVA